MAVTIRHNYAAGSATDISNVVVDSGTGRVLLVGINAAGAQSFPTNVTYGGVNMSNFTSFNWVSGDNWRVYYLLDPAVGTANVAGWGGSQPYFFTLISSIDGVDTTSFATAFGTPGTASGNSANPSASVASGAGKLVWGAMLSRSSAITVSSPSTDLSAVGADANEPDRGRLFSNSSGNASETCAGTMTSNLWGVWGVALNPPGAASGIFLPQRRSNQAATRASFY